MAAHLDGMSASVLDFMGFAQKGGSVLSFVRWADTPERLNQVRIDAQQADAVLACDLVVGASPEALQTVRHGRTRILANEHDIPVADSVRNPDADLKREALLEKLRFAAGTDRVETFDAQALAQDFLGDTVTANVLALGSAWQRGLVPVSLPGLQRAIELNGVAIEANRLAFALGRLAAADPAACERLREGHADEPVAPETLDDLIQRHAAHLRAYQDADWADRYLKVVGSTRAIEERLGAGPALPFTRAVTMAFGKLLAYKDEYEVARLYTDGNFQRRLQEQFEGDLRLEFHFAPPLLSRPRNGQPPRKLRFGPWLLPALRLLARGKVLRGTIFDPFGYTDERRLERESIARYERLLEVLWSGLDRERLALATQIAALPLSVRGFGHVKLANLALARTREAELLHRFDPDRFPAPPQPPGGPPAAGQIKGIAVVAR
jgi:indolepyruvate ferredoxin oxidoreductase